MEVTLQIRPVSRGVYVLRAQIFEGLRVAMDRRGEWGHFEANLDCTWDSSAESVTAFTVVAAPEITLPQWQHRATADEAHGAAWDGMLDALTAHEDEHLRIFENAINAMRRQMRSRRSMPQAEFRTWWDNFAADLQDEQDRYDRTSRNGQREGVVLDDPPSR